jgi:serine/threonine-protein kinase HipA
MRTNKVISVKMEDALVGTLAAMENGKTAFEYSENWLEQGFSISPFSLPLEKKVFVAEKTCFGGLFGVFADSLPDAWGNVLLNRILRKNGITPGNLNVLDRLAIVGASGMGALSYEPEYSLETEVKKLDLDLLAAECKQILETEYSEELDTLYRLGGTSGGARPKIMTEIDEKDWIIKFPARIDGAGAGEMEYQYSLCAKACGIEMTETKLFPSKECEGYFGTVRFDRKGDGKNAKKRIHTITAAALLEVDFEQPCLDYHSLMKLTKILTKDNKQDMENMYRRACFNVYAHNRDDHAKNFSFLYDREKGCWRLSPAYDMTYSNTYYGEHTTSVDGNGSNPGRKELLAVGTAAGMSKKLCGEIAQDIESKVQSQLAKYL